jgi:hypothetical protein
MRRWTRTAAPLLVAAVLLGGPGLAAPAPLDDDGLGASPYGRMHMLLEKAFLKVDVLDVEIRFAAETAAELRALAEGHQRTAELTGRIAARASRAGDAYVEIRFLRDVGLDEFLAGVRRNLERATRADMLDEENLSRITRDMPRWFAFLAERGIRSGDRLLYRVRPASLRTVYLDRGGEVLLDQTDTGSLPPRALLAGYFAPGSDFVNGLVASLFRG